MVHSLIPMSVDIKIRLFETPARLVNAMELACAIGMAYAQANLELPKADIGLDVKEFWNQTVPAIRDNAQVNGGLRFAITNYIFKKGDTLNEDALISLKLGYEFQ